MLKNLLTIFSTVFLAELGDKTQFAVLLFATRPDIPRLWVAIAASLALVAATVLAVVVGARLASWINPRYLEGLAGMGFIVIGIFMLASFIRQA